MKSSATWCAPPWTPEAVPGGVTVVLGSVRGMGLAPALIAVQTALVLLFVAGILSLPVVLTLLGVSLLPILASRRG